MPSDPTERIGAPAGDAAAGARAGQTVGAYRLIGLLGRGGMGEVYRAERADGEFHKQVAIKLLPRGAANENLVRRFRRERQILADLDHPGIARLLDGGVTADGDPYFVMELVDGRTLADEIPAKGVPLERFFEIAIALVGTLELAHQRGIVHRDLKPANIMVTPTGSLKVLDFGIAKRTAGSGGVGASAPEDATASLLTQQGLIVGSAPYMSPEQIRGRTVDERSDLFSLGVILFELIAGRRPFDGNDAVEMIAAILKEHPTDLRTLRPELPDGLVSLIEGCLAKEPERRTSSASELHSRLLSLQRERAATRSPATRVPVLDPRTVAVLPFVNLSRTDEADFLVPGLHNDLITELSRLHGLTVISRTSVMAYRDTDKPAPQIGSELGAGILVSGTVQSVGHRVRLTAQLVDAAADAQRWAERYDRELSADTLFSLQSELTQRIVESLRATFSLGQASPVGKRQTDDLEAYRLCSVGRMHFDRKTETGFRRAIEHFEQAVARDPDYVLAWVGLADAAALMEDYGYGESAALLERARMAARRALELDPDSAEAHTSLGLCHASLQNGLDALREYDVAIQLKPGYADAHNWASWMNLLTGRAGRALERARRAVQLDPLSAEAVSNLSLSLLVNGQPGRALTESRRAAELSPGWTTATFYEGLALLALGHSAEAATRLEGVRVEWAGRGPEATLVLGRLAAGVGGAGPSTPAALGTDDDPFATGLVELARGDVDAAFEHFDQKPVLGAWPTFAVHYLYGPVWSGVRDDPRHRELVRRTYASWGLEPPARSDP